MSSRGGYGSRGGRGSFGGPRGGGFSSRGGRGGYGRQEEQYPPDQIERTPLPPNSIL